MVKSNVLWVIVTWTPPVGRDTRLNTLPSRNILLAGGNYGSISNFKSGFSTTSLTTKENYVNERECTLPFMEVQASNL